MRRRAILRINELHSAEQISSQKYKGENMEEGLYLSTQENTVKHQETLNLLQVPKRALLNQGHQP